MFMVSIYIFVVIKLRSIAKTIFILEVNGISRRFGSSNLSCEISVTAKCFDFDG